MVKGNLLLESETFRLTDEELPMFSERMEAFMTAFDKCRKHGDNIYGKGDLSCIEILDAPLYEYCHPDTLAILQERIPGFRRDMHVFLTYDLMNYDNKTCNTCTTLDEIENKFPNDNNGLIGPECNRFNCNPELTVYSEESWNQWKISYLTNNPQYIEWEDKHPYLPNLAYSNLLLGEECRKRLGGNDYKDFYTLAGPMAGGQMRALSLEVGKMVAGANFYQYNDPVSKLNNNNGQIRDIYSLNVKGRQVYLSIDTDNAAFEICDYNGKHLGEYPFDGNNPKRADPNGNHDIKV